MLGQWNTFSKPIRPLSRWNEWFGDNYEGGGMQMGISLSFPFLSFFLSLLFKRTSFEEKSSNKIYKNTGEKLNYQTNWMLYEIFDLVKNIDLFLFPFISYYNLLQHLAQFLNATINDNYRSSTKGRKKESNYLRVSLDKSTSTSLIRLPSREKLNSIRRSSPCSRFLEIWYPYPCITPIRFEGK